MDNQGWIDIAVIAAFNRIRNLSPDVNVVRDSAALTPLLEVSGEFVRLRNNWAEWVLPNAPVSTVVKINKKVVSRSGSINTATGTGNVAGKEVNKTTSTTSPSSTSGNTEDRSEDGNTSLAATTVSTGGSQVGEEEEKKSSLVPGESESSGNILATTNLFVFF